METTAVHTTVHNKTEELIIYVASRLQGRSNYGSTLLNKALWLIDSMNYLKKGTPVSILSYIKQEFGPTPSPQVFLPVVEKLLKAGFIERAEVPYFGRLQKRLVAKRGPAIGVFKKDELVTINDVLDKIGDENATSISEYSHKFISWNSAALMEELPFFTFLLTSKEPDLNDYGWAEKQYKKHKKNLS